MFTNQIIIWMCVYLLLFFHKDLKRHKYFEGRARTSYLKIFSTLTTFATNSTILLWRDKRVSKKLRPEFELIPALWLEQKDVSIFWQTGRFYFLLPRYAYLSPHNPRYGWSFSLISCPNAKEGSRDQDSGRPGLGGQEGSGESEDRKDQSWSGS